MRIRHGELLLWELDPDLWVASRVAASAYPPWTYDGILKLGIHRFHRSRDSAAARRHIQALLERSNLRKADRIADVHSRFDRYVVWVKREGIIVCDSKARLDLPIGQWVFGGEVSRVELLTTGYRATLLGSYPSGWATQLRMLLIQKAVAARYQRPTSEVKVAVQELDGSRLDVTQFSQAEIVNAEERFLTLAARATAMLSAATSPPAPGQP